MSDPRRTPTGVRRALRAVPLVTRKDALDATATASTRMRPEQRERAECYTKDPWKVKPPATRPESSGPRRSPTKPTVTAGRRGITNPVTPEHAAGSIVIPANTITALRKALSETVNRLHDAIYDLTAELYRLHPSGDGYRFREAVREDLHARRRSVFEAARTAPTAVTDEYLYVLAATEHLLDGCTQGAGRPARPTHIDVDSIAPRPTMHDRDWRALTPDGVTLMTIRTEARTLTIDTLRASGAVTAAQLTPLGATLLDALAGIRWTRGSGGTITAFRDGAQDDAATLRYGPLGNQP